MQSLQFQVALSEYVESAATHLEAEISRGAEVPFELEPQRTRGRPGATRPAEAAGTVFYTYRALTGEFIAQRRASLERLPEYDEAVRVLEGFEGLDRYLESAGVERPLRTETRARARVAAIALLQEVFQEQTSFELRPERLSAALERLEQSALAGAGETTLVATLHGLTISSAELPLTKGLTIAKPRALEGLPAGALEAGDATGPEHLVVVLTAGEEDAASAIARGREVLKDLLRALRLFGDGRVTLGQLAWARVGDGKWTALGLGQGGRPHGMLLVTAEQEDELRAFCNLVSRRAPDGNELAWALRRFELGCERESALEALTDHLLALRVLLEPEGPASGLLPGRLAALCATPERRVQLTERAVIAQSLERDLISGVAAKLGERSQLGQREIARDIADHLRALLRDVICGHLDSNLVVLADELLLAPAQAPAQPQTQTQPGEPATGSPAAEQPATEQAKGSFEQVLGNMGQAEEILDIFI
jgi:hypothetical protein